MLFTSVVIGQRNYFGFGFTKLRTVTSVLFVFVQVMSVPVVVTVHGNQQCDAEATVFWENAFCEKVTKLPWL